MIKKKPAFPFETIAVAIAFSPRMEAILCEAKRLSDLLNAKMVLIHVGKHTDKKEQQLRDMLVKHNFNLSNYKTVWQDGHPVDTILKVCKENIIDLLVAGAMEKESVFRYYIGSVSREISRKAKCSVLMLTEPSVNGTRFKKIVVNGIEHPKSSHSIGAAIYLARHESAEEVFVVKELYVPTLAMSMADSSSEQEAKKIKNDLTEEGNKKIGELLAGIDKGNIKIHNKSIIGKTGYTISNFAKTAHADLLVINSPDTHLTILDRIFSHDIEYILADMPCNLLIVHSRI